MTSAEALIELDEHVAAKMEDKTVSMVHAPGSKRATDPVELTNLVTVMHRVLQQHQQEIKELKARLATLEGK